MWGSAFLSWRRKRLSEAALFAYGVALVLVTILVFHRDKKKSVPAAGPLPSLPESEPLLFSRSHGAFAQGDSPTVFMDVDGMGYPEPFWDWLEEQLSTYLDLDIEEDFEFKILYSPVLHSKDWDKLTKSITRRQDNLTLEASKRVNEILRDAAKPWYPPEGLLVTRGTGVAEISDLPRLKSYRGWEPLPSSLEIEPGSYDKLVADLGCRVFILSSGDENTVERDEVNWIGNRVYWAHLQKYCVLHLTPVLGRTRNRNTDFDLTAKFEHMWSEAFPLSNDSTIRKDSYKPYSQSPFSQTKVDPTFWRWIAFMKMARLARRVWKEETEPLRALYLNSDVMVTSPSTNLQSWYKNKLPWAHPGTPKKKPPPSNLLMGASLFGCDDQPVDNLPVQMPLDTDFIYVDNLANLPLVLLSAEVLLMPMRNEKATTKSMRKYWDSESGVLTYIMDRHAGFDFSALQRHLKDPFLTQDLLHSNSPMSTRSWFLKSSLGAIDEELRMSVLSPRHAAPWGEATLLRTNGRNDLVWQGAENLDSWVHLAPRYPALKGPSWHLMCTKFQSLLREPCLASARGTER